MMDLFVCLHPTSWDAQIIFTCEWRRFIAWTINLLGKMICLCLSVCLSFSSRFRSLYVSITFCSVCIDLFLSCCGYFSFYHLLDLSLFIIVSTLLCLSFLRGSFIVFSTLLFISLFRYFSFYNFLDNSLFIIFSTLFFWSFSQSLFYYHCFDFSRFLVFSIFLILSFFRSLFLYILFCFSL